MKNITGFLGLALMVAGICWVIFSVVTCLPHIMTPVADTPAICLMN